MSVLESIIGVLYRAANRITGWFDGLGHVVFQSRVSLFVIAATATLLALMPQGHEIGFTVKNSLLWYFLPVIFCSLVCWVWVRVILNQEFGRPLDSETGIKNLRGVEPAIMKRWITWVPRIVGFVPSAAAAFAVFHANRVSKWVDPGIWYLVAAIVVAVAVFAFVCLRRRLVEWMNPGITAEDEIESTRSTKSLLMPKTSETGDFNTMSPLMKAFLVLGWLVPLPFLLFGFFNPAGVGLLIGASAAVFIPATFFVSLLSTFVFAFNSSKLDNDSKQGGDDGAHFPVISVAIALALLIPFFLDKHRYEIRRIDPEKSIGSRPELKDAINAWFTANADPAKPDENVDMVIVATAGGALRAAQWTGTILGRLHDKVDDFDRKLFAISGVSGGSLGATAYMSALWEENEGIVHPCNGDDRCMEARIQNALSADFLGPVMLGLISNDVSLIGLGILSKDRAEALEEAWEKAWARSRPEKSASTDNPMSGNFLDLWKEPDNKPWPVLLLNGTHQQLGSRIITSNIDTKGEFHEGYDFFRLRPDQIAASTAVHNSARFSYISPAGKISSGNHIIDGGYFENYGAETALEIVRAVSRHEHANRINIDVIQIVSDPAMRRMVLETDGINNIGVEDRDPTSMILGQYTAPLQGLLKTREARGLNAAKRLKYEIEKNIGNRGAYFLFNMGDDKGSSDPALSWFMPAYVRENLKNVFVEGDSINRKFMNDLIDCLNAGQRKDRDKTNPCRLE